MSARIISTLGRAIDVIVAGRVVSHLRFAAGVFVLAAGLLMGSAGGAVAVADPDSSGSTANSTDTNQQPSTAANSPKKDGTDTKHDKNDATDTKHEKNDATDTKHDKNDATGTKHEKNDATDTKDDKKDSGAAAAVPDQVVPVATAVPDQVAPGVAAVPDQVAPGVAAVPDQVAPGVAAVPDQVAPGVAAVSDQVVPGVAAVAPRATAVPVPNLVGRVPDVIASIQDMFTSVTGAVVPLTRTPTGIAPLGGMTQAGRASSLPGMAPPAPNSAIPMGVRSFPRHALHDLPVAVSLAALAAVALLAVGGLVILTLAGVRVGYRQAKAGSVLRTAGIARFARRRAGRSEPSTVEPVITEAEYYPG